MNGVQQYLETHPMSSVVIAFDGVHVHARLLDPDMDHDKVGRSATIAGALDTISSAVAPSSLKIKPDADTDEERARNLETVRAVLVSVCQWLRRGEPTADVDMIESFIEANVGQ